MEGTGRLSRVEAMASARGRAVRGVLDERYASGMGSGCIEGGETSLGGLPESVRQLDSHPACSAKVDILEKRFQRRAWLASFSLGIDI